MCLTNRRLQSIVDVASGVIQLQLAPSRRRCRLYQSGRVRINWVWSEYQPGTPSLPPIYRRCRTAPDFQAKFSMDSFRQPASDGVIKAFDEAVLVAFADPGVQKQYFQQGFRAPSVDACPTWAIRQCEKSRAIRKGHCDNDIQDFIDLQISLRSVTFARLEGTSGHGGKLRRSAFSRFLRERFVSDPQVLFGLRYTEGRRRSTNFIASRLRALTGVIDDYVLTTFR